MPFKYKNVSEVDQSVNGLGIVKAGAEFTSETEINNGNFKLVGESNEAARVPVESTQEQKPVQAVPTKTEPVTDKGVIQ